MTRSLPMVLAGAALRDFLLPALRRLADWCDPAGSATPAWAPRPLPAPPVVPDRIPDALLIEQR